MKGCWRGTGAETRRNSKISITAMADLTANRYVLRIDFYSKRVRMSRFSTWKTKVDSQGLQRPHLFSNETPQPLAFLNFLVTQCYLINTNPVNPIFWVCSNLSTMRNNKTECLAIRSHFNPQRAGWGNKLHAKRVKNEKIRFFNRKCLYLFSLWLYRKTIIINNYFRL